jgi:hypothetical protein
MNNGDDSPRTITIEANSELVEQAKLRFAREIASGRLIGIADRGVSFPFGFVRRTRALVRSIELTHRGVRRKTAITSLPASAPASRAGSFRKPAQVPCGRSLAASGRMPTDP